MTNGRNHQPRTRSCEECNRKKAKCDKKSPTCHRCQQSGSRCIYPTHRKRTTLETKYQSLRKKLVDSNQENALEGLLDHIDLNILRGALQRREKESESGASSDNTVLEVSDHPHPEHALSVSDTSNLPLVPEDGTLPDDLHLDRQNDSQNYIWLDNMAFSPFTESYGMFSFINATELHGDARSGSGHSLSEDLNIADRNSYGLTFSPALVDELIDLFFLRVQPSIPLFHEPRFRRKFQIGGPNNERYTRLSLEDALTLTAMMALSARFSGNEFFLSPISKDKGKAFARKATALYTQALQSDDQGEELTQNSLDFLQGCILLAFYEQTNKITTQSWLLIGTCSRLAIDLGLNETDKNASHMKTAAVPGEQSPAEFWTLEEEKRRAWWLVWELDVFAATILRRPHALNKDQVHVLLPVSDDLWFSDTPTESTFLQTDMLHTWQTLENFPNADERAWFLVTTFLMARAADFASPERSSTSQDILNFESTLNCFALLLPQSFQLDFVRAPFNEGTFAANNWALLTVFMLHTVRVLVRNALYTKSRNGLENFVDSSTSLLTGPYNDTYLVFRAMQAWPPEYLIYACPFVSCTIIGPAFDNIRAALLFEPGNHGNYLSMLKLILKRIGTFWGIGETALRLVEIFENEIKVNGSFRKQAFQRYAKDFSLLVADPTRSNT